MNLPCKYFTVWKTAVQNIQWLAVVVAVFRFVLLLHLISNTGVTVTNMLVNVTLMLSVIACRLINIKYQINSKYQNKTYTIHRCNVMLT